MFHVKHIIKNVNHIKKKILRKVNSESEKAIIYMTYIKQLVCLIITKEDPLYWKPIKQSSC